MQISDSTDKPNVFFVTCHKCLRTLEVHGRPEILNIRLLDAGWVNNDGRMICPKCPAATDNTYNKAREIKRRAAAAEYPAIQCRVAP